jgi:hypothetical protein
MKRMAIVIATVAALGSVVVPTSAEAHRIGPGLGFGLALGALTAGIAAGSYYYGPYGYYRPRYYRPYYGPAYYGGWSPAYSYYGGPVYYGTSYGYRPGPYWHRRWHHHHHHW